MYIKHSSSKIKTKPTPSFQEDSLLKIWIFKIYSQMYQCIHCMHTCIHTQTHEQIYILMSTTHISRFVTFKSYALV